MRNVALGIAMVLVVLSLIVQYTDPTVKMQSLPVNGAEASAAFDYLARSQEHRYIARRTQVKGAWLDQQGDARNTFLWLQNTDGYSWLATVRLDQQDKPVSATVDYYTRRMLSGFLTRVAAVWLVAWTVCFAILPAIFGVKCPHCTRAAHWPMLTKITDRTAFAGGYDKEGLSLPPIIERSFTCPICGYRKVRHLVPEEYRMHGVHKSVLAASLPLRLGIKGDEIAQRWLKDLENNKTYDDWRLIFGEWKTRDREEHPAGRE